MSLYLGDIKAHVFKGVAKSATIIIIVDFLIPVLSWCKYYSYVTSTKTPFFNILSFNS